ncbi:MAG TPA: efflux RND transporter periplasmic adaptor subunit [Ktedonobacteraceae bacterium]|nr:efflux RND transporter periplasmic adaptor subunit [Ktedonobacteraceae bacterium]
MFRRIMIPFLVFVALTAIAGGVVYWVYDGYMYYRTDDAQVSGQVLNINSPVAGKLTTLTATVGQTVSADQVLGTITIPPANTSGPNAVPTTVNLTSPIDGTIIQVPGIQGQNVAPGLQLATVTNLNALTITAYVDENAINNLSVNQAVDIHIDAYGDTNFTGHIQQIVQATAGQFALLPNQDPTSGNFTKVGQRIPVVITLDNKNGKDVVPGMSAEVTIHLH